MDFSQESVESIVFSIARNALDELLAVEYGIKGIPTEMTLDLPDG